MSVSLSLSGIFIMALLDDFKHGYEGLVVLQDAVNGRVANSPSRWTEGPQQWRQSRLTVWQGDTLAHTFKGIQSLRREPDELNQLENELCNGHYYSPCLITIKGDSSQLSKARASQFLFNNTEYTKITWLWCNNESHWWYNNELNMYIDIQSSVQQY